MEVQGFSVSVFSLLRLNLRKYLLLGCVSEVISSLPKQIQLLLG